MTETENKLHWMQRVALVRHNLHASSRSGDFTFFRTLQATGFMEGTNHVAVLSETLGDEADTIMAAMSNLNSGLAYAHQDAFKAVYDSLKQALGTDGEHQKRDARSKLFVDCSAQRNMADLAIDKITSSTINLITSQPVEAQELVTNVWILGMTFIADAVDVSLKNMALLEHYMDDFIRMEELWNTVKAEVVCAITGIKGVFELMDASLQGSNKSSPRNSSIASTGASVFRRLSSAFIPSAAASRSASIASATPGPPMSSFTMPQAPPTLVAPVYKTPNFRTGGGPKPSPGQLTLPPTSTPSSSTNNAWAQHKLTTIPPTPAFTDDSKDPFDTTPLSTVPSEPDLPEDTGIDSTGSPFSNEHMTAAAAS